MIVQRDSIISVRMTKPKMLFDLIDIGTLNVEVIIIDKIVSRTSIVHNNLTKNAVFGKLNFTK